MTDFRKRNSILSFDHSGDLTRLRIGFRVKSVIALGSEVQKLILKTIAKFSQKNMRNKQSGILYKKKKFFDWWQVIIFFLFISKPIDK